MPGTNINIRGSFNSVEDLKKAYPQGKMGDTYLINGDLYYWNEDSMSWENAGHIGGPTGPTGPKGDTGIQSLQGPQGIKIVGSDIKCEAKANQVCNAYGTVITGLPEDNELTLVINADQDTELIFDGSVTAKLSVIKID